MYELEPRIREQEMAKFAEDLAQTANCLQSNIKSATSEGRTRPSKQDSNCCHSAEGKGYFEDGHEEMDDLCQFYGTIWHNEIEFWKTSSPVQMAI